MLEVAEYFSQCNDGTIIFQTRKLEKHMAIPREKVFPHIIIHTTRFKVANLTRH
jgi:hypothetical protein